MTTERFEANGIGPSAAAPGALGENSVAPGAVQVQDSTWLQELLGEETPASPEWPRTIEDVEKALEWAGEAEREIAEVQARLDAHLAAVRARAFAMTEQPNRRLTGLMARVEAWAQSHRGEVVRGKAKTRQLLTGSISFRATPEKIVITDEAAFLAWAQAERLDLLVVKTVPDKKALNASFAKSGELPPGTDLEPAGETITVKLSPLPTLTAPKATPEIA